MARIACAHCGSAHTSVAEVRECVALGDETRAAGSVGDDPGPDEWAEEWGDGSEPPVARDAHRPVGERSGRSVGRADPEPTVQTLDLGGRAGVAPSRPPRVVDGPTELAAVWSLDPGFDLAGESGPAGSIEPPDGAPDTAAELDPEQLAAVSHRGVSARIIAPAGSGKTRVLTERARHLVANWGVDPGQVCLVAFNVRARKEMEERLADLPAIQVRTLNSLGLGIVRGQRPFRRSTLIERSPDVLDEREVRTIIDGLVDLPRRLNTDPTAAWIEALAGVRLGLADPAVVEADFGGDVDGLAEMFDDYRAAMARRGGVDFDEQIYLAIEILLRDPDARASVRSACRVLLVDEFQDLTPAHLLLVRLVAGPDGVVFGVGDDDQTIYGHAGASPDWLIDFARFFPGAAELALETNYRCAPAVVSAAANLLTRNGRRVPKTIRAAPGRPDDRADLVIERTTDPTRVTVERVTELLDRGAAPGDVAVLTRVNSTLAPVQVALGVAGVASTGGVGLAFLERTGVRGALAWLRLALAPNSLGARDIGEAMRRPSRGVSPRVRSWAEEQRSAGDLRALANRLNSERDRDRIEAFVEDLEMLAGVAAGATTDQVLAAIRSKIGLGQSMERLDGGSRDLARAAHGDDLASLESLGRLEPEPARFERWLRERLAEPWDDDGVDLATIHRVKGQEWPHVIVHDVTDGLIPHRLSSDVEEERRILHVGLTRSRATTAVVAQQASPSPFLAELDEPGEPPAAPPPAAKPTETRSSGDEELRETLRSWRMDRARSDGVPAYVVFNDRTLDELIARRPTSRRELGSVHGIGPSKLEKFGDELIAVLTR